MTPPRPTITMDLILEAARAFCAPYGMGEAEAHDLASAYASGVRCGFKLGVALDRKGWDIDAPMVDDLDGFDVDVRKRHRDLCRTWAAQHDIQPPYPIGTMLVQGEITGISTHDPAHYEVRCPGDPEDRRVLIPFEAARLPSRDAVLLA